MGSKGVALCSILLALVMAGGARAELVRDLYSAQVPVANQGSQALSAASKKALSEVLVKVSGSYAVLKNPVMVSALAKPRSLVLQYAYIPGKTPGAGLSARFEFDRVNITDLLAQAGAPVWTANRPMVLAWVVVEDEYGRHFVNWETQSEQAQQLVDEFSRRGVPVQLPLFDLTDTAAVSPDDAWRLDALVIQSASARYDVHNVLIGRLAKPSGGESSGEWRYFHQNDRISRSVKASDLSSFVRAAVNIVADEMAARYAMTPMQGDEGGVRMTVSGVSSYADYAAVVGWLEGLELIEYATIERVQRDRIELRLQANADAAHLATLFELNERLLPLPVPGPVPGPGMSTQLSYQWQN